MTAIGHLILQYPLLFGLTALADALFFFGGSLLLGLLLFRLTPHFTTKRILSAVSVMVMAGVLSTLNAFGYSEYSLDPWHFLDLQTLEAILPVIGLLFIFAEKKNKASFWKPLAVHLIYNIAGAAKYVICMFFKDFDYKNQTTAGVIDIQLPVDIALFLLLLGLWRFLPKRKEAYQTEHTLDLPLYLLIVFTLTVFVLSMLVIGVNFNPQYKNGYWVLLLNIPTFVFTVAYAVRKAVISKMSMQNYKNMMEEQIRYYKMVERKNEELRIFRHDFPKKMAPLLMHIQNDEKEQAVRILRDFDVSVQASRPRFVTGNPSLDIVLEC